MNNEPNQDGKNEPNEPNPATQPDDRGQNPFWPGQGLKKPDDSDENTKIPEVR
jgi:hypothetical protein